MKRKAFIQAVILFCLLAGTWILLIIKLTDTEKEPANPGTSVSENMPEKEDPTDSPSPSELTQPVPGDPDQPIVPPSWQPWIDAFAAADSPETIRNLLDELKSGIMDMERNDAIFLITEFLESGLDIRTGLAFQMGRDNELLGAGYLRAMVLDWLFQLDPQMAASLAKDRLQTEGTGLTPDEYAVHMRNYRLGTTEDSRIADTFLKERFGDMIHHEPWLQNPVSAVAKAFEAAVVTEATEFVPEMVNLMKKGEPQLLRNAAAVTLERLVDRASVSTIEAIIRDASQPTEMYMARAGYLARLDPSIPEADSLFDAYLNAPGVSREEIQYFLQSFPNLNQTFSYPLFGNYISSTNQIDYIERFQGALKQVRQWESDPDMQPFSGTLAEVKERLLLQLREIPSP